MQILREFSSEIFQMLKKHLKKCLTSLANRKMQTKIALISNFTSVKWLKSKTQVTAHAGENVDQREYCSIAGGNTYLDSYSGKVYGSSSESW